LTHGGGLGLILAVTDNALSSPFVRMRGIGKSFGAVSVLRNVDLDIYAGEVLILAGENGAGKSTLIKILGGVYTDFDGSIEIAGQMVRPQSPLEARGLGVSVIFQELSLVPSMTVVDNLFLGRPLTRAGWINDHEQKSQAQDWFSKFGIDLDVSLPVEQLPMALRQMVEIIKAISHESRALVMDEPTSSLNAPEVDRLFKLIQDLKSRGCAIVYITHKLEEIQRIADRIVVLRDGQMAGAAMAAELPPNRLIHWMVGREMNEQMPHRGPSLGAERLRVAGLTIRGPNRASELVLEDVSLTVQAGEIVGVAGLQGSGSSDLLLGLFGGHPGQVTGQAWLDGQLLDFTSCRKTIDQGVALLTNDRKATGLVLPLSVIANVTLANLPALSPGGWRRPGREQEVAAFLGHAVSLRAASLELEVEALSGGNQQKVALAKWLQIQPRLLMLDEPTRGIDVAAKHEIYQLLNQLTSRGMAILLITSELPELLALSDRILVLHRGRTTALFERSQATAEKVLAAAMGNACEPSTAHPDPSLRSKHPPEVNPSQ
jgi:ribose transport system ATP-binding protein